MKSSRAYRLDLLYKWRSGEGLILTPRGKLKWEESYAADTGRISEGENYLLINLVYSMDEKGNIVNTGYSLNTNFKNKDMMSELGRS